MAEGRIYRGGAIGHTGAGNFGHGLHLGLQLADRAELVAVADPDETGREQVASQMGVTATYADYRVMLEQEELDIVTVGPRWVDRHEEMVSTCVEAGCHVYCEKPLAESLDSGDRMVQAADLAGVKLAVAHQGVYLPQVHEVRKMLESGRIGEPHTIFAHGKQDRRGGGEDMMVLGTHLFNMMRFFFGDVAWMSAQVTCNGEEIEAKDALEGGEPIGLVAGDRVNSYFAFSSGRCGFFDSKANQGSGGRSYGLDIVGTEGQILIRGGGPTEIYLYPHAVWDPGNSERSWEIVPLGILQLGDGNRLAIEDLIAAIEEDRDPLSSGREAVCALEMILGAYASQIAGSRIQIPMKDRVHPLQRLRDRA